MDNRGRQSIKIKIKRCSHDMFWYKEKIGEIVSLVEMDEKYYYCLDDNGNSQPVMKQDGEMTRIEK